MPPSPTDTPWVVDIEDPSSVRPQLLHTPLPDSTPSTPTGGRRGCPARLRSRVAGSREPRHRRDGVAVSWSQLAVHAPRPAIRTQDRAVMAVTLICTLIGVWLGSLAPASSPVSAPTAAGAQHRSP
jgi:hypothetical protein